MNGKDIYEYYNNLSSKADKKEYLLSLNEEQKILYKRYWSKLRQDKFKQDKDNVEKYNEIRNKHIKQLREKEPKKMSEQNKKDVKAYYERTKQKKAELDNKLNAVNKLIDAIKAKKARDEMAKLKKERDIKKVLNDIIDTIPKKVDLKVKREYMREYRARKAKEIKK